MPNLKHYFSSILLCITAAYAQHSPIKAEQVFQSHILDIPPAMQNQMRHSTWYPHCPIRLEHLAYVELSYWGFDAQPHMGTLIVHKELAAEVVAIFNNLFDHHFPIERMELIEHFQGDDKRSMSANNTSAFNCRRIAGYPNLWSQHSYGRAIDINPLLNPYVKGTEVYPPQGKRYLDRKEKIPGKILKGDIVYRSFIQYGWDWGGNWYDAPDYQHFEKRAHSKKRNPYGLLHH